MQLKHKRLTSLINRNGTLGGIGFFGANIGPDAKNSNRNVISVGPGG
jgi:endothelin-converting enzyme/putative endopeptidase